MNKQLLQRALDALEKNLQSLVSGVTFDRKQAAIAELRAAIDAVAPYHMPDAGEMVQLPCTPDEAARICSTLGPVPDGKTWAQHMVDTARTGWVPSTMGHAEYLVEPWPILGGS